MGGSKVGKMHVCSAEFRLDYSKVTFPLSDEIKVKVIPAKSLYDRQLNVRLIRKEALHDGIMS